MIPSPLHIKSKDSKNCVIKKSQKRFNLEREYKTKTRHFNVLLIPKPSFEEFLALKYSGIL